MNIEGRHIVKAAPPFPAQDFTDLEARLGLEPIRPLDGIDYWGITVNRRVVPPSCHWLKLRSMKSRSTTESGARLVTDQNTSPHNKEVQPMTDQSSLQHATKPPFAVAEPMERN